MLNKENDRWTFQTIKEAVKVLKNNEVYRLGDGIKFKKSHKVIKHILKNTQYDNTILKLFHQNSAPKPNLYQIVERKRKLANFTISEDNTLMVHIRLGDDINKRGLRNSKNFDFFVTQINKSKCTHVKIVTALHYGTSDAKDALYRTNTYNYQEANHNENIQKLHDLIRKINKPVDIVSNEDVDLDVLHLVFCKHLLTSNSTGSFSKLVQQLHNEFISHPTI